jgi:hypothetical protein
MAELNLPVLAAWAAILGLALASYVVDEATERVARKRPRLGATGTPVPQLRCHTCGRDQSARATHQGEIWCITRPTKPVCRTCVLEAIWRRASHASSAPTLGSYLLVTPTHTALLDSNQLPVVLFELGKVPCTLKHCPRTAVIIEDYGITIWWDRKEIVGGKSRVLAHCGRHTQTDLVSHALRECGVTGPTRRRSLEVSHSTTATFNSHIRQWQTPNGQTPQPWNLQPRH